MGSHTSHLSFKCFVMTGGGSFLPITDENSPELDAASRGLKHLPAVRRLRPSGALMVRGRCTTTAEQMTRHAFMQRPWYLT